MPTDDDATGNQALPLVDPDLGIMGFLALLGARQGISPEDIARAEACEVWRVAVIDGQPVRYREGQPQGTPADAPEPMSAAEWMAGVCVP